MAKKSKTGLYLVIAAAAAGIWYFMGGHKAVAATLQLAPPGAPPGTPAYIPTSAPTPAAVPFPSHIPLPLGATYRDYFMAAVPNGGPALYANNNFDIIYNAGELDWPLNTGSVQIN